MKALFLVLLLAGCGKIHIEVVNAEIDGKPVSCHRFNGEHQWTCSVKRAD